VGARFSTPIQTGPVVHPASSTVGTRSFQGVKRLGHGINHPLLSSTKLKESVELYLYSLSAPSWQIMWWILPFITLIKKNLKSKKKDCGKIIRLETSCPLMSAKPKWSQMIMKKIKTKRTRTKREYWKLYHYISVSGIHTSYALCCWTCGFAVCNSSALIRLQSTPKYSHFYLTKQTDSGSKSVLILKYKSWAMQQMPDIIEFIHSQQSFMVAVKYTYAYCPWMPILITFVVDSTTKFQTN